MNNITIIKPPPIIFNPKYIQKICEECDIYEDVLIRCSHCKKIVYGPIDCIDDDMGVMICEKCFIKGIYVIKCGICDTIGTTKQYVFYRLKNNYNLYEDANCCKKCFTSTFLNN
jgi:hypothetical protein